MCSAAAAVVQLVAKVVVAVEVEEDVEVAREGGVIWVEAVVVGSLSAVGVEVKGVDEEEVVSNRDKFVVRSLTVNDTIRRVTAGRHWSDVIALKFARTDDTVSIHSAISQFSPTCVG